MEIRKSKKLKLQLIVTRTHLSSRHGLTYREIINDNLKINKKVKILGNSDTPVAISNYLSKGIKKFSKIFYKIKPNLIFSIQEAQKYSENARENEIDTFLLISNFLLKFVWRRGGEVGGYYSRNDLNIERISTLCGGGAGRWKDQLDQFGWLGVGSRFVGCGFFF